jgi:hypothetical protein
MTRPRSDSLTSLSAGAPRTAGASMSMIRAIPGSLQTSRKAAVASRMAAIGSSGPAAASAAPTRALVISSTDWRTAANSSALSAKWWYSAPRLTLAGNDTGGALCQFIIDTDSSRIGRLVLTNCDAFDQFPPPPVSLMVKLIASPARLWLATRPLRWEAVRHSRAGYGPFVRRPLDAALTQRWVTRLLTDAGVRRDTARFMRGIRPADLLDVSTRLGRFTRPVLLHWGTGDRFFTMTLARRLAAAFPDARLVKVEGGHTFLPLDEPDRIASEISTFLVPA